MPTTTPYFFLVVAWVVIPGFQCGYHISALNQLQAVLSCRDAVQSSDSFLPSCIPMDDTAFGILTSQITVGGLLGSLVAPFLMRRDGRRGTAVWTAVFVMVGSGIMAAATGYVMLVIGRFILGIGTGLGVCVVPIYLSEVTPLNLRGGIGVLNQLSIVTGLLVTQAVGIPLAAPSRWRFVLLISAILALVQICTAVFIVETPAWLKDCGRVDEAEAVCKRLWGPDHASEELSSAVPEPDETAPLLRQEIAQAPAAKVSIPSIGLWQLVTTKELRRPVALVIFAFLAQQGSGINAIFFYSNDILGRVLPNLAAYISLLVTAVNVVMTFPPIFLMERVGRRAMLLFSIVGSIFALLAVAIGINVSNTLLSSVGVVVFVALNSIGLGPVPFIMISEVAPFYAVGALAALAIAFNSVVNFVLSVAFLPLRDLLSQNGTADGNIFYIFVALLSGSGLVIARMYHP